MRQANFSAHNPGTAAHQPVENAAPSKPDAQASVELPSQPGVYKPDAQASGELRSQPEASARDVTSKPKPRTRRRLRIDPERLMSTLPWIPEIVHSPEVQWTSNVGTANWESQPEVRAGDLELKPDAQASGTSPGDRSRPQEDVPVDPKLVAQLAHVSACSIEFGTVAAPFVIPDVGPLMLFSGHLDLSGAVFLDGEGTLDLSGEWAADDPCEAGGFR